VDAPVGPVQHEGRRLATCEDSGNREVSGPNLTESAEI
jgi:hypothetical protein